MVRRWNLGGVENIGKIKNRFTWDECKWVFDGTVDVNSVLKGLFSYFRPVSSICESVCLRQGACKKVSCM